MNTTESNLESFQTQMFPISQSIDTVLDESLFGLDLETIDFSNILSLEIGNDAHDLSNIIEQELNKHQPQFLTPESTFNEPASFISNDTICLDSLQTDLIDISLLGFDFMTTSGCNLSSDQVDIQNIQSQIDSPSDLVSVKEFSMVLAETSPSVEMNLNVKSFYDISDEESSSQFSFSSQSISKQEWSSPASSLENIKRVKRRSKIDKKESNKAAAIRYRTKKQKEKDELFKECDKYAKKNTDLKRRIDDLQTEISFIKSLLVEALIKKNQNVQ